MTIYKNKEESWIKISIFVGLQCVDLQCTIFWITCRFSVRVDLQCMSIYSAITIVFIHNEHSLLHIYS